MAKKSPGKKAGKKSVAKKAVRKKSNVSYLIGVEKVTLCIPFCRTCNKKLSRPANKKKAQETLDSHEKDTGHDVQLICSD